MQFNKKSSVYKITYYWHESKPERSSLCKLFWQFLSMLFLVWPLYCVMKVLDYTLVRGVGGIFAVVFFGYRPTIGVKWHDFVPISWWPKYKGKNIMLGKILGSLLVCTLCLFLLKTLIIDGLYRGFLLGEVFATKLGTYTFFSIIGLLALYVLLSIMRKHSWWQLTVEYLRAKKENVCPEIVFVD